MTVTFLHPQGVSSESRAIRMERERACLFTVQYLIRFCKKKRLDRSSFIDPTQQRFSRIIIQKKQKDKFERGWSTSAIRFEGGHAQK